MSRAILDQNHHVHSMDMVIFPIPEPFRLLIPCRGALFAPPAPLRTSFFACAKKEGVATKGGNGNTHSAPLRNGIASRCLDEEKVTNPAGSVAKNPGAKVQSSGDLCDSLIPIRVHPSYTNRAAICVPERFLGKRSFPKPAFFPSFFAGAKKEALGCRGREAPLQSLSQ